MAKSSTKDTRKIKAAPKKVVKKTAPKKAPKKNTADQFDDIDTAHDCFHGKVVLRENKKMTGKNRFTVHQERKGNTTGYLSEAGARAKVEEFQNDTMF